VDPTGSSVALVYQKEVSRVARGILKTGSEDERADEGEASVRAANSICSAENVVAMVLLTEMVVDRVIERGLDHREEVDRLQMGSGGGEAKRGGHEEQKKKEEDVRTSFA
jgi:hypothetical protein